MIPTVTRIVNGARSDQPSVQAFLADDELVPLERIGDRLWFVTHTNKSALGVSALLDRLDYALYSPAMASSSAVRVVLDHLVAGWNVADVLGDVVLRRPR